MSKALIKLTMLFLFIALGCGKKSGQEQNISTKTSQLIPPHALDCGITQMESGPSVMQRMHVYKITPLKKEEQHPYFHYTFLDGDERPMEITVKNIWPLDTDTTTQEKKYAIEFQFQSPKPVLFDFVCLNYVKHYSYKSILICSEVLKKKSSF